MKSPKRHLTSEVEILRQAARMALPNSHSPYSRFRVASAIITEDNRVFAGCNVENASYGATVCAERVAIFKAVSEGSPKIKAILVLTETNTAWAPCGMCRQVMLEFAGPKVPVYLASTKGKRLRKLTIGKLCPESFSPAQLKR